MTLKFLENENDVGCRPLSQVAVSKSIFRTNIEDDSPLNALQVNTQDSRGREDF